MIENRIDPAFLGERERQIYEKYKDLIEDENARRRFILERLPYMTLMNDYFFAYFMRDNPECMEVVLQTICGNDKITVKKVVAQDVITNLGSHGNDKKHRERNERYVRRGSGGIE